MERLTPSEKVYLISCRLRDSFRRKRSGRSRKRLRMWEHILDTARQRRAILELERTNWEKLIVSCGGNVSEVSRLMGYSTKTGEKSIWDLGLWPTLVRTRLDNGWIMLNGCWRCKR
jgi:hypothetical protein